MFIISEYITAVLKVAVCAFLCEHLSGSFSKSKTHQKGLRLITNICVFIVIISPLINLAGIFNLQGTNTFEKNVAVEQTESLEELTERELNEQLKRQIHDNTGITVSSIHADLEFQNNNAYIKSISGQVQSTEEKEALSKFIYENIGKEILQEIIVTKNGQD
ncbi:MAG: hypothetical protein J6E38_06925 [Clostridia bacterium]|nr:hypothetical protein [Clostridia bacterium]